MRLFSTASAHFDLDQVLVSIPSKESNGRIYLTWQAIESTVKLAFPASEDRDVTLRNAGKTGEIVFGTTRAVEGTKELTLTLPKTGAPVAFWIAGQKASVEDGDAVVEVVAKRSGTVLGAIPLMVRVRKDATTLTVRERNRFLWAMGQLNGEGSGDFKTFRLMHFQGMELQAHGVAAFLPWHRAYLLDLERALQAISPSVALPYWRFDEPAGALFTESFLGKLGTINSAGKASNVKFADTNPLALWTTDSQTWVTRAAIVDWDPVTNAQIKVWDPLTEAPPKQRNSRPWVIGESDTLALGATYQLLQPPMEGAPHGSAHVSWRGFLDDVPTAAKDPLFFLLHCNVDRLWAKWQKDATAPSIRIKKDAPEAYHATPRPRENYIRLGQHLTDTMWPWNSDYGVDYASFPAGGDINRSTITDQPSAQPTIEEMIDYQGIHSGSHLGFDYDKVPFR
jgi:tyrosinase